MNISLQGLITILVLSDQKFAIEPSDQWEDSLVLKFICPLNFLAFDSYVYLKDQDKAVEDRNVRHTNRILCHYCMKENKVLSICNSWFQLIKNAKSDAIERREKETLCLPTTLH